MHSFAVATRKIPRLVIFSLALILSGTTARTAVETPRTIRVVMDNDYAPYVFQSDEGEPEGILIDQWRAWEKKTGIKVEIHAMNWGEALRRMRAGEFDVIDSIVETAERHDYVDFTAAYATVEASIFFRSDISGIADLASLAGFPVGVKAGDQHIDKLKASGVTTVIPFQNFGEIVEAARQHKINVFVVDIPSALYLLNKMGIEPEFRHSAPIFRDELRRAVRKGDANLLRTVSEGFAAIEPGELEQIDEKWFGRTINWYGRYLRYAGYAAAVAILLIAGLVGWNRTLRAGILQRTAALGQSEQRFRQIAENIREVFWMSTPTMDELLYVSPAYESIWGRSVESLRQRPRSFIEAIHAEDREHVIGVIQMQREQGFEVEYRVVRPDGSVRWIRDRGFPVKDPSGNVYRIAGVAEDITGRKYAGDALRQSAAELQALSRRLVELQESERRQLSRELHDRVGQNLTALRINLDILQTALAARGNGEARSRIDDSAALLDSTMDTIENVLTELRPPMLDDHGLAAALDWHARSFSTRTGIAVAVRGSEPAVRPPPPVQIALFRIAQEALNNVAKHARARRVEITLDHANGECVMSVQDDGIGFEGVEGTDKPKPGLGMITMRERSQAVGGRFEVQAVHGHGTRLTVRVPY
jgi:PAS domain S-box-containing protein